MGEKLGSELATITAKFAPDSTVEQIILKGDAPSKIERVAKDSDVDLIVMPTHGYGTFRRFVLGSVTTKVLHDLECPVLTGAHVEEIPFDGDAPYQRIVCAVDLREHSDAVLQWASGFGAAFDAELTVVHAAPILDAEPETESFAHDLTQMLVRAKKEEVRELLARNESSASVFVDCDTVTNLVPKVCREWGRRPTHHRSQPSSWVAWERLRTPRTRAGSRIALSCDQRLAVRTGQEREEGGATQARNESLFRALR